MLWSVSRKGGSGLWRSGSKHSITPRTSAPNRIGNPNAPCGVSSPPFANGEGNAAREEASAPAGPRSGSSPAARKASCVWSSSQTGSAASQTRPGSPTPRGCVRARLAFRNAGSLTSGFPQLSEQHSLSSWGSTVHRTARSTPRDSQIASRRRGAALARLALSARMRRTACRASRRRSTFFRSVISRMMLMVKLPRSVLRGLKLISTGTKLPSLHRAWSWGSCSSAGVLES